MFKMYHFTQSDGIDSVKMCENDYSRITSPSWIVIALSIQRGKRFLKFDRVIDKGKNK